MSENLFFLVDLSQVTDSKPVEILRTGDFVDRNGRQVQVVDGDIDIFVAHFEANLAGQEIPIDIQHKRDRAAGWVRNLVSDFRDIVISELDEETGEIQERVERVKILLGEIDWNSLGKQLVGDRVYRYLSGSIDIARKTIRSISLVNFPAVKGLLPVELSAQAGGVLNDSLDKEGVMGGDQKAPEVNLEEMRTQLRAEFEAELQAREQKEAEMREEVRKDLTVEFAAKLERRQALIQFVEELYSGDNVALSAKPDDVVAFLESLNDDQSEVAKELLQAKLVDLGEVGSSSKGAREGKEKLSAGIAEMARQWVADKRDLVEFFAVNAAELGSMDDYDLSEFANSE